VADSPRIQELRRRIQQDPASLAFAPLAEELRRAGRLGEAVQTCRAGLALHTEYATARATLGRALLDQGALDDALAELTTVLAAAPEHLAALKGIAEIHARRGEDADALVTYRRAQALAREDAELARAITSLEQKLAPGGPAPLIGTDTDGQSAVVVRRLEHFLERVLADRARRR
jgi:tetratricopeptide (TPR) repeat protein